MENIDTYRTTSRRLEQFMYAHFIHFIAQQRNEAGDTVWIYEKTNRFKNTLNEYIELCRMAGISDGRAS